MKGEEAEYIIPLGKAFLQPRSKRIRKALNVVKKFVFKHTKNSNLMITTDVNNFLHKNSKNIPRRISAVLWNNEGIIGVYLKGSKQLEEDKKKKAEKAKEEKTKKGEKKPAEEKVVDEEQEKKKKEKKARETAIEKANIKRKVKE